MIQELLSDRSVWQKLATLKNILVSRFVKFINFAKTHQRCHPLQSVSDFMSSFLVVNAHEHWVFSYSLSWCQFYDYPDADQVDWDTCDDWQDQNLGWAAWLPFLPAIV